MPKGLKVRKHVTSRIVTKEDVENVLYAIKKSFENGESTRIMTSTIDLLCCLRLLADNARKQRLLASPSDNSGQPLATRNRLLTFCRNRTKSA
jgi:hypothetical protein